MQLRVIISCKDNSTKSIENENGTASTSRASTHVRRTPVSLFSAHDICRILVVLMRIPIGASPPPYSDLLFSGILVAPHATRVRSALLRGSTISSTPRSTRGTSSARRARTRSIPQSPSSRGVLCECLCLCVVIVVDEDDEDDDNENDDVMIMIMMMILTLLL